MRRIFHLLKKLRAKAREALSDHRQGHPPWREEEPFLLKLDTLPGLMNASEALDGVIKTSGNLHVWMHRKMCSKMWANLAETAPLEKERRLDRAPRDHDRAGIDGEGSCAEWIKDRPFHTDYTPTSAS